MTDDVQKQLDDLEYVPRTYEQAVAERAQRRRDALEQRRQDALETDNTTLSNNTTPSPQQAIVDNVTKREGGRLHGDHLDYTNKASGAFYRNQRGAKQHSGAYFRRQR